MNINTGPMDNPPWTFDEVKKLDRLLGGSKTDEEIQAEVDAQHDYIYANFAQTYYPK